MAEDPDAIPSLQLAWEMIELARVIYKARDEVNFELENLNYFIYLAFCSFIFEVHLITLLLVQRARRQNLRVLLALGRDRLGERAVLVGRWRLARVSNPSEGAIREARPTHCRDTLSSRN